MAVLPTGIGPVTGYNIERSLRFNSADSAYLNRTFGTSTNQSIFTYSVWIKLGRTVEATTNYGELLSGYTASGDTGFGEFLIYNGKLRFSGWATNWRDSTQLFRDSSAWYHVVLAVDTTQATAANRIKMYVNGSEITAFSTNNNPTQNSTVGINNNSTTGRIGQDAPASSSRLFDGYMAEANFIDGQALTPASFGETDASTGVWKPKAYTGTYGTNGFFLKFADNSNTTAATLGKDSSGNGNNWTPNNFSVAAGAGNDSLVDSPTSYGTDTGVGGSVRGNYATVNPIGYRTTTPTPTITNGNLDVVCPSGTASSIGTATFGVSSGKWYWEVTKTGTAYGNTGIVLTPFNMAASSSLDLGGLSNEYVYVNSGSKFNNNSSSAYGASWTNNDVIGVALDLDAGTLVFYKNGSSQGTAFSSLPSGIYLVGGYDSFNGSGFVFNFGQRAFAYTAPSGFKALCTQNLPTPTIGATSTTQANDYFDVKTYTGDGTSPKQVVTGLGFQPDLIWSKDRNLGAFSVLYDAVRGVGSNKALSSGTTDSEGLGTTAGSPASFGYISSINSDGYTATSGSTNNNYHNANAGTYVSWNWNAGGSNATNTAGTITSTVRASTTSGFSIVTYTGTGANATVGHGLGVAPGMVIVKIRSTTGYWTVQHSALGSGYYGYLNFTNSFDTANANLRWNSTNPSSTVFSIGTASDVNTNTATYVAYCFAPVAGYSAFGSYTGNGSADGPFVFTNFRPRYVMIKRTDSTSDWTIYDTSRSTYNQMNLALYANLSNAEGTTSIVIDTVSNGIKIRNSNADTNASGGTYIYACFAESPFKYSLAR